MLEKRKEFTRNERKNTIIKVTGLDAANEKVVGVDLNGGQEFSFSLHSPKDDQKERYAKRPSLKSMIDGFKVGRETYKLEIGAIIAFEGSYKDSRGGEKDHLSTWPTVMAYTPDDAEKYVKNVDHAILRVYDGGKKASGSVLAYDESSIVSGSLDDVSAASTAFFDKTVAETRGAESSTVGAAFLVRALDADGKVVGAYSFGKNNTKETKEGDDYRRMTTVEFSEALLQSISEQEDMKDAKSFSVVPATRYAVSNIALNGGNDSRSRLGEFKGKSYGFVDRYEEGNIVSSRSVSLKVSDGSQFVSNLVTNGLERSDPALLGGLEYNAELQAQVDDFIASGPFKKADNQKEQTTDANATDADPVDHTDDADPFAGAPEEEPSA